MWRHEGEWGVAKYEFGGIGENKDMKHVNGATKHDWERDYQAQTTYEEYKAKLQEIFRSGLNSWNLVKDINTRLNPHIFLWNDTEMEDSQKILAKNRHHYPEFTIERTVAPRNEGGSEEYSMKRMQNLRYQT